MKVKAKYQISYNNILYLGGDIFEIYAGDFLGDYKNDVEIVDIIEGEIVEEKKVIEIQKEEIKKAVKKSGKKRTK